MNGNGSTSLAQRTCLQCKASKKKCDKLLPKCNRCLRLATDCTYAERERASASDTGQDNNDSRFDEVFKRLEKIESHVFTANTSKNDRSTQDRPRPAQVEQETPRQPLGKFRPDALKPSNMRALLYSSVVSALGEADTTIEAIARIHFATTHRWLPIISRTTFDKQHALFRTRQSDTSFLLQISAMHLLVTPYAQHPPASSLKDSAWYVACKSFFAQHVALNEPCIEVIQAGVLIALFEYLQCIGDQALITLGICTRLGYVMELDEVVAAQADYEVGQMTPEGEEVVLTYWALSQLDRYFNMPPQAIPKHPTMYSTPAKQAFINDGCGIRGPPLFDFKTIDAETLEYTVMELEASRKLGRVHNFIRDNRHRSAAAIADSVTLLMREIQEYALMNRIRSQQSGSWAGMISTLSAGLQLQCFFADKQGFLDEDTTRSLYSYVKEITEVVSQCRILNGFTENYLEGVQPTWSSVTYQAIHTCNMIRAVDDQNRLRDIDLSVCLDVLQMMAPRYNLAAKCLELLKLS